MNYEIEYAYACHKGKVRSNNEDNFWCCGHMLPEKNNGSGEISENRCSSRKLPVLALFDGMGGENCGEVAAKLAAEKLGAYYHGNKGKLKYRAEEFVQESCREMNQAVCNYAEENRVGTMGTTMAMAVFGRQKLYACNVGDSRIYQERNGAFFRISTDHIMGNGLFGKAPLTQYLGIPEDNMVIQPAVAAIDYQPGTRLLLCSDGITDMLTEVKMQAILSRGKKVSETVNDLIECALEKGGRDNATVILCQIHEKEAEGSVMERLRKVLQMQGNAREALK